MNLQSTLLPLQQFLALNKKAIEKVFLATELFVIIFLLITSFQFLTMELPYSVIYSVGRRLGQISLITYLITLTPGILQRLRVLMPLQAMLNLFRRHFGILTFLLALSHSTMIVWLPQMATGRFMLPIGFTLMGAITLTCFFPMWLTSSDYAQQRLGKWWKRLHRITYIAAFFLYLHVSMQLSNWRWPVFLFLALEVISWGLAWWRLLTAKPIPTATPQPAQTPVPPVVQ